MQPLKLETKAKSGALEGLNPEQEKAVTHKGGPLLIVAGAGTGKTTVITRRIAHLIEQGINPSEILAVTFTDKAAEEMAERVDLLLPLGFVDVNISTFHALGERVLHDWGLEIGLPDFEVLNEVGQWLLVKNNLDKFDLDYYKPLGSPTRFIKALVSHFSKAKDELVSPEQYLEYAEKLELDRDQAEAGVDEKARVLEVANAYHTYQKLLLDSGKLDFGDLINYPLELFKKRPQVLKKLQNQYKYILVDEFQDTNLAQYELVKMLTLPENNITVVGDDDQSIFKFRGASLSNIMHFKRDFPDAESVALVKNYRNGQKILDEAYRFISQNNPDRLEVKLGIDKKLRSDQKTPGNIEQIVASDYHEEARLVVTKIMELMAEYPELTENDFAILARSHSLFGPFIAELERQGFTYIYAANEGLYKKPVVLDLLSYFKLLDSYHESEALYRVLKLPVFNISEQGIIELSYNAKKRALSLYQSLQEAVTVKGLPETDLKGVAKLLLFLERHTKLAKEKSVNEVYRQVFEDLGLAEKIVETQSRDKYIETFSRKIQDFQAQSDDTSLRAFLSEIEFERAAGSEGSLEFDPDAGPEAVKLLTIHSAKGLEFSNVFIVGLVDKRFPSINRKEPIELPDELVREVVPEGDAHLEEERRLFYVAMTRAKFNLYLTRAYDYGGKLTKKPSRFLAEMGLAGEETSKPTGEVELVKDTKAKPKYEPPKEFSWSHIADFISCPLKYKYRHVLGLPEKSTGAASFGRTIHKAFEKYLSLYKQMQGSQDLFGGTGAGAGVPGYEALKKFYEESWIDEWYETSEQKEGFRKEGYGILKQFHQKISEDKPEVLHLEHRFRAKLGEHRIKGFIDRVDRTPQGLTLIDYKTGKPRKLTGTEKEQLLLYQLVGKDIFDQPIAGLQYWYLREEFTVSGFIGSDQELEKLRAKVVTTIEKIIACTKNDSFRVIHDRSCGLQKCEYQRFEL